jgi:uncharacterized membrane protein
MIGLALLVLSLIFFYSVAILIVVDAMITVGVVFLVSGLGIFGAEARKPKTSAKTADLSALDRVVLQMISQNNGQEEIAKSTGVSPAILADKSAALTSAGYLSGNHLTEKGFEALRDLGVDRT